MQVDDAMLSRVHSFIVKRSGTVAVKDAGSKNGTWINGTRLGTREQALSPGDLLRVGGNLFMTVGDTEMYASWGNIIRLGRFICGPVAAETVGRAIAWGRSGKDIVIVGETGTGKEVLAREIHDEGAGSSRPFVPVNCAAIPAELFESELFGVVKGAYSGADHSRAGYMVNATDGTLYLDEIGELPLDMQVKLLRVVEERRVYPVGGGGQSVPFHARIIAATNRDLPQLVRTGGFRDDLFYRLWGFTVEIPPLRRRREDVALMVETALQDRGETGVELTVIAMERLCMHAWPGNTRQLLRVIDVALSESGSTGGGRITSTELPGWLLTQESHGDDLWAEIERVLFSVGGNIKRASETLGISRQKLYDLLTRRGKKPDDYR